MEYLPFGETLVEEHLNSNNSPYKFNAKEFDSETGNYYYGARYYDSKWSIWLSVDKMATRAPQFSPYIYSLNNPVSFFDPDGNWPWPVTVRSFISSPTAGAGFFRGDGRDASFTGTSRVYSSFIVDPSAKNVTQPLTESDFTLFYGSPGLTPGSIIPPKADTGTPIGSNDNINYSGNTASFDFNHSGKDPLTPSFLTPELDLHANLNFNENLEDGILTITGAFKGDKFPSTEAFITDQSSTNLFLGAKKERGGLLNLFGDNKKPLFNVNMQVMFDNDGNFTGVKHDGNNYSVENWNKKVQEDFNK